MKKIIIAICLLGITQMASAQSTESIFEKYKAKARGFVANYISEDIASKIFGAKPLQVQLPKIPKVNLDTKVSVVIDESKVGKSLNGDENVDQYNYNFIVQLYEAVRKEKASENDISNWMNVLSQGGSREGVYHALVLDTTYGGLENMDMMVNDGTIRFTVGFFEKFFSKNLKKERLEGVNIYTLKRELVRKILNLMDTFASQNPEDLYKWYAVVSADLAKEFSHAYKGNVRTSTNSFDHYRWAKSVPYQYLKSEMIIKVHTALNSLN